MLLTRFCPEVGTAINKAMETCDLTSVYVLPFESEHVKVVDGLTFESTPTSMGCPAGQFAATVPPRVVPVAAPTVNSNVGAPIAI